MPIQNGKGSLKCYSAKIRRPAIQQIKTLCKERIAQTASLEPVTWGAVRKPNPQHICSRSNSEEAKIWGGVTIHGPLTELQYRTSTSLKLQERQCGMYRTSTVLSIVRAEPQSVSSIPSGGYHGRADQGLNITPAYHLPPPYRYCLG